jgi:hypothetical protein
MNPINLMNLFISLRIKTFSVLYLRPPIYEKDINRFIKFIGFMIKHLFSSTHLSYYNSKGRQPKRRSRRRRRQTREQERHTTTNNRHSTPKTKF